MSEAEVFYRVHWNWGTVPFDADHAYSHLGGEPPLDDTNSAHACIPCDGKGDLAEHLGGIDGKCPDCDGEGSVGADRGYSCASSPEGLLGFAAQIGGISADGRESARVVVFEGDEAGYGCDGEPLVVPSRVVRVMTWGEFAAENA